MLQYIDVYRQEEPQAKASLNHRGTMACVSENSGRWRAVFELWPPRLESELLSATPEVLKLRNLPKGKDFDFLLLRKILEM